MPRYALLPVPLFVFLTFAGTSEVEIRYSEVWLIGEGRDRAITHDGKEKHSAAISPSATRIAYVEGCDPGEDCMPSIVVVDLQGRRVRSYQPNERCGSIQFVGWSGAELIAAECHVNPSLSRYIETDISSGATTRELLGYDFTPSPDGRMVAHVGWMIHFAPPYAQSNYLQIEHTTIYPLPLGVGPVEQIGLTRPPSVVSTDGVAYRGIHEFLHGLHWSPDSQRIALIDCTYDWTPNSPSALSRAAGIESGRSCQVAVVSTDGQVTLLPLSDLLPAKAGKAHLSWTGVRQLLLDVNGLTRTISVP